MILSTVISSIRYSPPNIPHVFLLLFAFRGSFCYRSSICSSCSFVVELPYSSTFTPVELPYSSTFTPIRAIRATLDSYYLYRSHIIDTTRSCSCRIHATESSLLHAFTNIIAHCCMRYDGPGLDRTQRWRALLRDHLKYRYRDNRMEKLEYDDLR